MRLLNQTNRDPLSTDDTPAVNFRDPVTMLSFGEFAISVFTIPVFSLAIIGIVKRRSSLFLPYFGFTAAVIIAVLGYSLLALLKPGARTEAFCGFGLIIIEAQMLYSAMTFYFQLKMHWWEHHKESVVCEPAGKVRLAIQSKIKELPPSAV